MNLKDIIKNLNLSIYGGHKHLSKEITGGYVSDILSSVLTYAEKDNIWVTFQRHLNIVPIAAAKEIAAIILVSDRQVDEATLIKAEAEQMPLLGTSMDAFQVVGKLYQMGIRGCNENV